MSGLYGVADILAIAQGGLADRAALRIEDGIAVAGIGPRLFAADKLLGRAVEPAIAGREGESGRRADLSRGDRNRPMRGPGLTEIFKPAFAPAFASAAALAIAAKAGGGVEHVGPIDPDDARFDLRSRFEAEIDVLGPDRRGKAVGRVVGERNRLIGRAESHRHEHRPEDLDLRDGRGRLDIGK